MPGYTPKLVGLIFSIIVGLFFNAKIFGYGACASLLDKEICAKIGQMLIVGFGGFAQDAQGHSRWNDSNSTQFNKRSRIAYHIATNHIGGVILFTQPIRDRKTGQFMRERNIQHPRQLATLNQELQRYNQQTRKQQGLPLLPLFIGIDQEGGRIDRLPANLGFAVTTLVPQALGAKEEAVRSRSTQGLNHPRNPLHETYTYARRLAQELAEANINVNFAPVVDVNINPTNPIIGGLGRSFSANPEVVVNQATQFIRAFHASGVIPVLKHFPGHGSSRGDSHDDLVDVTATYQQPQELYPYYQLIHKGYNDIIMTAHVINGKLDQSQCKLGSSQDPSTWCPATMSYQTLTLLLRQQLGFKGLIVSDDMTMGAIAKHYPLREALKQAVNAGVDLLIIANNNADLTDEVITTLATLVKNGEIKRETIYNSYARISRFKQCRLLKQCAKK